MDASPNSMGGGGQQAGAKEENKKNKVLRIFSRFYKTGSVERSRFYFFIFFFLATPEVERLFPKTWLNVVDAGLSSESGGCSCRASVAQAWLGVPDSTETHPALITS